MSTNSIEEALAAYRTLSDDLPGWLAAEPQREATANAIAGLEKYRMELDHLNSLAKPEPYQLERLALLRNGADADKTHLAELIEQRHRHEEATARLAEAERILFSFAGRQGIDAEPLTRLLALGELERADAAYFVLRRVADALQGGVEAAKEAAAVPVLPAKRKTGRRKNTEKDSATLVVAALSAHHGYKVGGSVTNPEPAKGRELAQKYKLSNNAMSRFLNDKLGDKTGNKVGKEGHRRYAVACRNGRIGVILADWNRDLAAKLAGLRPEESGREDDD